METLPVLVTEQILGKLSVQDLLACSRVSVAWRAMVNSDFLWRKVCLKTNNKSTIDHVQNENSTVAPKFQELDSTTLEPLCHWRVVFMKLQHVHNNWRSGNYTRYKAKYDGGKLVRVQKYNDIFVAVEENGKCGVWNLRDVPRKMEDLVLALSSTSLYQDTFFIHLREDLLVIVQDTLLQVYRKLNNSFQPCSRMLFNLPETLSSNIPSSKTVDEWYLNLQARVNLTNSHAEIVLGKYFIGVDMLGKASFCHIWDTLKGSKLKEECIFNLHHEEVIDEIEFRSPRTYLDKILVVVQYHRKESVSNDLGSNNDQGSEYLTTVYLYDFVTLTFKRLRVMSIVQVFYEDTLFLTVDDNLKVISTFNSSNGGIISSTSFDGCVVPNSIQVEGDYLSYVTTSHVLVILDIKRNFEAVFKVPSKDEFYHCRPMAFIGWDLVLASCYDGNNKIAVWSVKGNKKLCSINVDGEIWACDNSTNLFIFEFGKAINVLKFW